jgi:hypothetical protein
MLVDSYQTTRYHVSEGQHLHVLAFNVLLKLSLKKYAQAFDKSWGLYFRC